jgi:3-oxoacyl-[acyl-carrier protein] reductase
MDLGISGKWALVCGASKGLGLGCARALVQEGVNVLMVARGAEALQAAAEQLAQADASKTGASVQWLAADITTEAGRAAVLAQRADFDILVTNAGGPPSGDFRSFERDDWIRALDANMLTPIALIKATVDGMITRGFGRIVNITSSAVKAPLGGLAAKGVTINNLLPGAFDTERLQSIFQGAAAKTAQPLETVAAARRNGIPAKRFGTPDEFGAICAFLCSRQAGYMTGQNVLADGGAYPGTF